MREDPENYRHGSLISVPGKILENIILSATERLLRNKAIIGQSHHKFLRGDSCVSNLISFYDKVICQVDKGKAMDISLSAFQKGLRYTPHSVPMDKLSNCETNRYILCWVMN